jgi:uncharacterized membrane protein YdbT with pleckstrin-like domain
MGYIESNLVKGETVEMKAKVHWAFFLWPVFLLVLLWVMIGAVFKGSSVLPMFNFGLFFLSLIVVIQLLAIFLSTEFGLTNRRIIAKTGLIRRHSLELMLSKVESINVNQGLLGRIFNYGTITVVGSGGTRQSFPAIERPMELRKMVNQIVATD